MNPSARWGFDIDSVVGDLSSILERVAWEEYGVRVSKSQFTEFQLEKCLPFDEALVVQWINTALEPRWTLQMEPYPGAVEVLTEISRWQPLYFVTARPDAGAVAQWLRGLLEDVPGQSVHIRAVGVFQSKLPALRSWGVTHFVEDRLETCEALAVSQITPIVFHQPWNARPHPWRTVKSWEEIRRLVTELSAGVAT